MDHSPGTAAASLVQGPARRRLPCRARPGRAAAPVPVDLAGGNGPVTPIEATRAPASNRAASLARSCLALLLGLGLWAGVQAQTLRLCTADQPFRPFTSPDGQGSLQRLLRRAAHALPLRIDNYVAPRARCLQDARQGQADALIAIFTRDRLDYLAYPMAGTAPDVSQALAEARFMLYRRKGSAVDWDGRRFSHLDQGAIGVQRGFAYGPKLALLEQPVDAGALSAARLLDKLERGRVSVVILQEEEALAQLLQRREDRIEPLPEAFDDFALYLAVTPTFLARHTGLVQQLWRNIAAQWGRSPGSPAQGRPVAPALP